MEIVRKSISFPVELADKIAEKAKEGNRSFSAQVVYDMALITDILVKSIPLVRHRNWESYIEEEE